MKKRIAIITGTRADYGVLETVIDAVDRAEALELGLIVTGTHLTTGSDANIQFPIAARVEMQSINGAGGYASDVQALGRGIIGIGRAFDAIDPDLVLVLGDRIEALAGALAASVGGRLLAHIHGGDRAQGVADEGMRHAISKLSHLHFPATLGSADRLKRMGEDPARIHVFGSPSIDALGAVVPDAQAPALIVMQHPTGLPDSEEHKRMRITLEATANHNRLIFAPNHDPGHAGIRSAIESAGLSAIDNLPRDKFLALLAGARAIAGNSSAGLIEAAALGTPCINLGDRQRGREAGASVIHCDHAADAIREAIDRALAMDLTGSEHPYGDGTAGQRIADFLEATDLRAIPRHKCNLY